VSKKSTTKPYQLLTDLGTRTIKLTLFLFTLGIGLQFVSKSHWDKICSNSEKFECTYIAPYAKEMSTSLVTSAITLIALEILFKRTSLEEIREIFGSTEATKSIKAFYPDIKLYRQTILDDIEQKMMGQGIKILGLSHLELDILCDVENNRLMEKICSEECKLRIIVLHPDSTLLKCIENLGYERTNEEIHGRVHKAFKTFAEDLMKIQNKGEGSIEVRTHKDIFSPAFYYSSNRLNIVGLYFALGKNSQHPAFDILDKEMKKQLDSHFEEIWDKSISRIMLRWNVKEGSDINKVMEVFPKSTYSKTDLSEKDTST
jgi:hypothetical protein